MMKQVVFVTANLTNGGAERVTAVLADALSRDGVAVTVAFMKDACCVYPLQNAVKQTHLFEKGGKLTKIIRKIANLRRFMKAQPDATFVAMLSFETLYTFIAALGLKINVVYSLRNDPASMKGAVDKFIMRVIYPRARRIVFQTADARDFFPESIREKGVVIPNPISDGLPAPYTGVRKKEFVSVGRLAAQKNYPMLLRAFRAVHDACPDWRLRIFGKGDLEDELKALAEGLGLRECVAFAGFSDHVVDEMNQSGCFVLSSDYEGISNAMLEALAMGVPCIVTDCPVGGARMFIEHGVNGLLCPVGDTEALTQAMLGVIRDPEAAKKRAERALSIRETLAPDAIARAWKEVL